MKAYIAGKITGDPDYSEKFSRAKESLEERGYKVLSPAILPEGMTPADYMRICIAMMESADVVAFLPDYTKSRGAKLEWAWCQYVGKRTMYMGRPVAMANADRIRAMSNEELAEMISAAHIDEHIRFCQNKPECDDTLERGEPIHQEMCKQCLLEWLSRPAEEEK